MTASADGKSGEDLTGEAELERIADIARRLSEAESLDETLQRVVDLAVGYIDKCDGATLMFIREGGQVVTPASSSLDARKADEIQYEVGEGPCLSAMGERETIVVGDLDTEERWPAWRDKVTALGWRSMLGLRLFVAGATLGALDLYSRAPHAFDSHSRALAQVFASHASVALKASISDLGLHKALESRDIIGQAKGVLMERERLSGQQAFERLARISNERNIKLRDLAQQVADTGDVPD